MAKRAGLFRDLDRTLLVLIVALCVIGLLLISSATASQPELQGHPLRQGVWVSLGLVLLLLVAALDYQGLVAKGYTAYITACVMMVLLLLTAKRSHYGAASWFNLHFFYLQPSELCKVALILGLAQFLTQRQGQLTRFVDYLPALGMAGFMMLLILREPDLGMALVLLPVTFTMLYVAGVKLWQLLLLGGGMAGTVPLLWPLLKEYQRNRVLTFLDPSRDSLGAGYNVIQSEIAVGSGGIFGQGYRQGTQSQLHFVPFHHTDFIFSVLGEEWGLAGELVLLALILGLLARVAHIGGRSRSLGGALICTGLLAWLGSQTIINIGMGLGALPVTGLPLPMVSYGGSSTMAAMLGLGLVMSVHKESQ